MAFQRKLNTKDNGVNTMKSFNEYLSEGSSYGDKPLKKTVWKDYLISTVYCYGEYETMVFKKYPNQEDYDYDGLYESRTKSKAHALLTHHFVEEMVKSGKIK